MHAWERLLDDAKADAASAARVRQRWLERQATEGATLSGTLLDLAESGAVVSLSTIAGRRHDGALVGIGADFVLLADRGEHVAVRLAALTMVRAHLGRRVGLASGDRAAALDLTLVELLARILDAGPEMCIGFASGDQLTGVLRAVGADVATLQVPPGGDGFVYASVERCASVRFRSG